MAEVPTKRNEMQDVVAELGCDEAAKRAAEMAGLPFDATWEVEE